jgi:hypothetical protein
LVRESVVWRGSDIASPFFEPICWVQL